MMGKNHVAVNTAVTTAAFSITAAGMDGSSSLASRLGTAAVDVFIPAEVSAGFSNGLMYNMVIFFFGAGFMFWMGSLLPDIDSHSSTFGQHVHLPFKHRTWTHSIWACLLLLLPAIYTPWFRWLLLGYVLHLIGDAVSAAGLCFLYPIQKYQEYASGAFVAPGHKLKLYRTNDGSERRFVILTVCLSVVLCFFARAGVNHLLDWIWL